LSQHPLYLINERSEPQTIAALHRREQWRMMNTEVHCITRTRTATYGREQCYTNASKPVPTYVVLRLRPQHRPEMPDATRPRYRDRGEPKAKGSDVDICM
jgi:hypothetical protein